MSWFLLLNRSVVFTKVTYFGKPVGIHQSMSPPTINKGGLVFRGVIEFEDTVTLREEFPSKEFFWSIFSCIRTEYRDLLGLNIEIYKVNLRIQSEYWKIRPEKTPYWDTFHAVLVSLFRYRRV